VVINPPDCPLRISSIDTDRLSAFHFDLGVVVVNRGERPISYYSITYSLYSGQSRDISGTVATGMGVIGSSAPNLGSGQSHEKELGVIDSLEASSNLRGLHQAQRCGAIDHVEVAVDFVEFVDRTTWGPDLGKNAQILAGMRAGAREAHAYLKGVFESGGDSGLASATAAEHLPLEPPKNSGPEWKRGFRLGTDTIRTRVKQAMESKGTEAAAKILNQPLDS